MRSNLHPSLLLLLLLPLVPPMADAQFTDPTPAELSMTSIPQVPGAPAVYLYREETTEDAHNMFSVYVRLKVLTEKGIDEANVEVPFLKSEGGYTVDSIYGRTIHADGTVIPLTGKPYDKLIDKTGHAKYMAKVFTMPSVEVGSIVEYRYKLHSGDNWFRSPRWYIQSNLYTLKAHYMWRPTNKQLVLGGQHDQLSTRIAWMPILPKGADFQKKVIPGGQDGMQNYFELNVVDVPPAPEEEFMPPIESFTYRLIFYYSAANSVDDYWKTEGKYWSKEHDRFIGPGKGVKADVEQLVAPSDTPDQKLHKLYAAVMQLENTDYTRRHTTAEERADGLRDTKTSDDVLARKRGTSDQLSDLFVAMARAAGLKAYVMAVTDRDRSIFLPGFLTSSQLDDDIAIVDVDGKEQFFDPGSRYCEYGHLAWKHSLATGLRQSDKGVVIASAPGEGYKTSVVKRIGDLALDEHGAIDGTVSLTMTGDPALEWRQRALRGDGTALNKELKESLESMLPNGLDVHLLAIEQVDDFTKPFVVRYRVSGPIGNSTGKRLLVPADIFLAAAKPTFTQDKRTTPVYFHYTHMTQDAVRIKLPDTIAVESVPAKDNFAFKNLAGYNMSSESTSTSLTVRRNFTLGDVIVDTPDYPALRTFYNKFEAKDQEPIVLTRKPSGAGGN